MHLHSVCCIGILLIAAAECSASWLWFGGHETTIDGRPFQSMRKFARDYDLPRPKQVEDALVLKQESYHLELKEGSRRASLNGIGLWLHEPIIRDGRRWYVSETDVATVLRPLTRPEDTIQGMGHRRIVLDPGHGGADPGGIGAMGTEEKDMTLLIAQGVADLLKQAGHNVRMTRSEDVALSLSNRTAMARAVEADLFVSIHFNVAANPDASGIETFVLTAGGHGSTSDRNNGPFPPNNTANQYDGANQLLGYHIQRGLIRRMRTMDRGVRRARFAVLREAPCPAVLVECGFLSHALTERTLHKESYRKSIAAGIAQGIMEYVEVVLRVEVEEWL